METMKTADAICPVPRMMGWFDVAVRATYTSDSGKIIRIAHDCYLDAHQQEGPVFLGDGVEMLFHHLGLELLRGEELRNFCDAVTAGFADATSVEIPLDEGELLLELTPWQEVPGSLLS